jgi:tRNA nucleotidyltransferase/poly(A) polymerase
MHPVTGEIHNPFGGKEDIEARRLRVTDVERFQDDPLRVMRAVQFVARMELSVEAETLRLMREMVERGDLSELPAERMIEEWKKMMLKGKKPSLGIALMRDTGIMARHYPELLGVIDDVAEGLDRGSILLKERDGEEKFQVLFAVVVAKAADPAKFLTHFESEEDKKRGKKGSMASVRKEVVDAIVSSARGYGCISALAGVVDERAYLNQARMAVRDTKAPTWLLRDVHAVLMPEAREARDRFARVAEEYSLDELAKSVLLRGQDLIDRGQKPGKLFRDIIVKAESLRDAGELETRDQALAWLDAELQPKS